MQSPEGGNQWPKEPSSAGESDSYWASSRDKLYLGQTQVLTPQCSELSHV